MMESPCFSGNALRVELVGGAWLRCCWTQTSIFDVHREMGKLCIVLGRNKGPT